MIIDYESKNVPFFCIYLSYNVSRNFSKFSFVFAQLLRKTAIVQKDNNERKTAGILILQFFVFNSFLRNNARRILNIVYKAGKINFRIYLIKPKRVVISLSTLTSFCDNYTSNIQLIVSDWLKKNPCLTKKVVQSGHHVNTRQFIKNRDFTHLLSTTTIILS